MGGEVGKGITIRQMWEGLGGRFSPKHFVSRPGAGERVGLHIPFPEVPKLLMRPGLAEKAQVALDICVEIAGGWGQKTSEIKKDSDKFRKAETRFWRATGGVKVREVLDLARERLFTKEE